MLNDSQFKHLMLSSTSFWLNMLDEQANVVMWDKGAEKISGYKADEVLEHQNIWELLYPDEVYRLNISNKALNIIKKVKSLLILKQRLFLKMVVSIACHGILIILKVKLETRLVLSPLLERLPSNPT